MRQPYSVDTRGHNRPAGRRGEPRDRRPVGYGQRVPGSLPLLAVGRSRVRRAFGLRQVGRPRFGRRGIGACTEHCPSGCGSLDTGSAETIARRLASASARAFRMVTIISACDARVLSGWARAASSRKGSSASGVAASPGCGAWAAALTGSFLGSGEGPIARAGTVRFSVGWLRKGLAVSSPTAAGPEVRAGDTHGVEGVRCSRRGAPPARGRRWPIPAGRPLWRRSSAFGGLRSCPVPTGFAQERVAVRPGPMWSPRSGRSASRTNAIRGVIRGLHGGSATPPPGPCAPPTPQRRRGARPRETGRWPRRPSNLRGGPASPRHRIGMEARTWG